MESVTEIIDNLLVKFLEILPKAIVAMVILAIFIYLAGLTSKLIRKALDKRGTDQEVKLVISKVTHWSLIVIGVFVALQQLGFDLSAFLVSLGIVGFTIGFALQDISKNFVAGMLLLIQQPFDIGNAIEVSGYSGTVIDVDLRATEIRTFDGTIVLIPNADVYTSPITNFSRGENRRIELTVGVASDTNLELARSSALDAIKNIGGLQTDPAPQIIFNNFGASSIDFTLYFWINIQENSILTAKDQAIVEINQAFSEKGVEIPYPVQTVLMKK
jgi:small conductance mechanosensitive channel